MTKEQLERLKWFGASAEESCMDILRNAHLADVCIYEDGSWEILHPPGKKGGKGAGGGAIRFKRYPLTEEQ